MAANKDNPNAFKHWFNRDMAKGLAADLAGVDRRFDQEKFLRLATKNLAALELKERVAAFAAALRQTLPSDYKKALALIVRALPPELGPADDGFADTFRIWPYAHFVETYGLEHPRESLAALYQITKRATAEFAIRPYIARDPALALSYLEQWVNDPNEHVRRLVSEGTRTRLPWGMRLKTFAVNPAPLLALLERLKNDPSAYVRRSVGNNLNDLLRDNPDAALALLRRWRREKNPRSQEISERALRSLVKAGHPEALSLLGHRADDLRLTEFALTPARLRLGQSLQLQLTLRNHAATMASAVVDYAIHFLRQNGASSRKVFKLRDITLPPQEKITIAKNIPIRAVTTRRHYAGTHKLDVQVNGQVLASAGFELRLN